MNYDNQINIFHIVRSFDLSGRSRLIYDICRGCESVDMKSLIVSLTGNCGYKQNDVDILSLGMGNGFQLSVVLKLIKLIRCRKITVIHNHGRGSLIYAALASIFVPRVKLIHTIHRADGDLISRRRFLCKWVLGRVDEMVAVSKSAALEFAKVNGYSADKIKVIYNGIDLSLFEDGDKSIPADDNPLVIGTVANLSGDKDIETLLKAFANMVVETGYALSLRIIGDGPRTKALHELANHLDIYKNVHFMGFRKDVPEQLAKFDIFVLSTRTEGFGISILEAMASGVPVVASRVGGVPEIIADGKNGLLFDVGDVSALADKIVKLIEDDELRKLLVANAKDDVKRRFGCETMVSEYKKILI